MSTNAGGAATGVGMQYQAKIIALLESSLIIPDVAHYLNEKEWFKGELVTVGTETDDNVDDIYVSTEVETVIQAKNSINLSSSDSSEFIKVIRSFIQEFMRNPERNLVLVGNSVSNPLKHLGEIFDSARDNPLKFQESIYGDSRKKIFEDFRESYERIGGDLSSFNNFIRKVYICEINLKDIQIESLFNTGFSGLMIKPSLFWAYLTEDALSMIAKRKVVDSNSIHNKFNRFIE
ncbi:hypothetical protein, partial [Rothia nasimurium]|uniref:hypothetical protein n=1 Tax=Rothia nasimurium TaxID=85336 RepID=UPI001F339F4B